jgi:hypothetical protein
MCTDAIAAEPEAAELLIPKPSPTEHDAEPVASTVRRS